MGLTEEELGMFVRSVINYFKKTTGNEPKVTSAFLGTSDVEGYEFNGVVTFSGSYNGQVAVSMPSRLLRELLLVQGEKDISDGNLLDTVGEIANTLAGNARKTLGAGLEISVPVKMQGAASTRSRVRKRPYVITLTWAHQNALVCVDMEKKQGID